LGKGAIHQNADSCNKAPYSSQIVEDIYYKDLSHLAIHHFFVAKCARLLKDNGIIAMVLPLFFLDNTRDHARDIISQK